MLFLILPYISNYAQTKTWDGGGTSSNWSDPDNWFPTGVPTALDFASIEDYNVNLDINDTIRNLELIDATLNILNNRSLVIKCEYVIPDTHGASLDMSSCIINQGDLVISESVLNGINLINGSCIHNEQNGRIQILDAGDPSLPGAHPNPVYLDGDSQLFNDSSGFIQVIHSGSLDNLIVIDGSLINRKNGIMELENSGFHNNNILTNRGEITIHGSIYNNDSIYNSTDGIINILGTFLERGFFLNQGLVKIESGQDGVEMSFGNIENSGTLYIDNSNSDGIEMSDSRLFNTDQGEIFIVNSIQSYGSGIALWDSQLENDGKIMIEDCAGNGLTSRNSSSINNADSIIIGNNNGIGLNLQDTSSLGSFNINIGGSIIISNCGIPICIDSAQIFDCQGTLEIEP